MWKILVLFVVMAGLAWFGYEKEFFSTDKDEPAEEVLGEEEVEHEPTHISAGQGEEVVVTVDPQERDDITSSAHFEYRAETMVEPRPGGDAHRKTMPPREDPGSRYVLKMTVQNGGRWKALINDRFVVPGAKLDPSTTVVTVGDGVAIIEHKGRIIRLREK